MKRSLRILFAAVIIFALVAPRVSELTKFTAADEPFWLVVGANYYYALTHGEFENTVYEYHPAVTTMWIGTAAMLFYFPEYRGLMNGYFQQEKTSFDSYLVEHGKEPLDLLWWARLFQLLLNVILLIAAFFLLRMMLDEWIALSTLLIVSFTPYLFGQSRMLNHETMLGLFSLICVLAMTAHLYHKPRAWLLILSAVSAALANLTKSSAIVLLPVVAVMLVTQILNPAIPKKTALINSLKTFFMWIAVLLLTYFILWPGMWVDPAKMLYEVYGNAFSYALQGARLSVTQELQPSTFSLNSIWSGTLRLLVSIAWHTTPITWIGLGLMSMFLFSNNRELIPAIAKRLVLFMFLTAFACVGMFALVQGRDQPHYLMISYYAFEYSAALGWVFALRWLARSFDWARKPLTQAVLFAALLIAQAYPLFYTAPYYFTYLNPLMVSRSSPPIFFYGEKMEEAAAYLSSKPEAQNLTALVYFGRSFSYYFPGETLLLKPIYFEDKAQLIGELAQSDYLVIYAGLQERLPVLKEMTPEHVIELNGRRYVEIYNVKDIPAGFFK